MKKLLQREVEVAFSRHSQPVWFRVMKWILFIGLIYFLWNKVYFWWVMALLCISAVFVHFYYRYKTKRWTQSYGLWNYEHNKPKGEDNAVSRKIV